MPTIRGHNNPHLGPLIFEGEFTVSSPLSAGVPIAASAISQFALSPLLWTLAIPQGRVIEIKRAVGLVATDAAGVGKMEAQAMLLTLDDGTIEYLAELPPGQFLADSAVGLGVGITLIDDWYSHDEEPDFFPGGFVFSTFMAGLFKNTDAVAHNVYFQFLAQVRRWIVKEPNQRPTIDWTMGQIAQAVQAKGK